MAEPLSYADALSYLRQLGRNGIELGLERVRAVAARMGDPQNRYPSVLIAGTNGKGSTSAFIASTLQQAGLKVGLYTSPHLVRETERIRISGADISEEHFAESAQAVLEASEREVATRKPGRPLLTAFEFFTLTAFGAFARAGVDVAVVEVGLGGRLDATNIVDPLVSVVTPVGMDHQEYLGTTIEQIAAEKAGILRPGVPVVSGSRAHEAKRVLAEKAREIGAPFYEAGSDFDFLPLRDRLMHYAGMSRSWRDLNVGLSGMHQLDNAAMACAVAELLLPKFVVSEQALREGLEKVRWRGRLETLSTAPLVLADGAHNVDGARVLRRYLEQYVPFRKIHLVVGQRPDKDAEGFLAVLAPVAARITLTQTTDGALREPQGLAELCGRFHKNTIVEPDLATILRRVYWRKPDEELLVVTGSLYLVGEAIALLESGEIGGYVKADQ